MVFFSVLYTPPMGGFTPSCQFTPRVQSRSTLH